MQYSARKRKYIDSIIILIIGVTCIAFLGRYIKTVKQKLLAPSKPAVNTVQYSQFLYVVNTNQQNKINIFHTDTLKTDNLYSTNSADYITSSSLFFNHILYTHSNNENLTININTKTASTSPGDYISPDGKKFISEENTTHHNNVQFSLLTQNNTNRTIITTQSPVASLNKILGWSPDSSNFYYTTSYAITTQTPMQATDHWIQKVGEEMKPMSRIRTWTEYSTSSAIKVFKIDTQNKTTIRIFNTIGLILNIFYDNNTNQFYTETKNGIYNMLPGSSSLGQTLLPAKIASSTSALIFAADNTNRFLHSSGPDISLTNLDNHTDQTLFYASNSATVTPLRLTGNTVIFSIQDQYHSAGELLDSKRLVRTEFINQNNQIAATPSGQPISFISWVKKINIKF